MSFIDGAFFFFFLYVHRMSLDNRCPCQTLINHQYQLPKTNTTRNWCGQTYCKGWPRFFHNHCYYFHNYRWKIFKYNAGIKRLISDQLVFFSSNFSSEQAGYVINISADNPPYWCLKRMERLSRSDTSTSCPPVLIPYKSLS